MGFDQILFRIWYNIVSFMAATNVWCFTIECVVQTCRSTGTINGELACFAQIDSTVTYLDCIARNGFLHFLYFVSQLLV
jgi:hypothetical protein